MIPESYSIWVCACTIVFSIDLVMTFNSSPPSAAYMRQRTGSALVNVMACHLFGAKPLPEPMLIVNWTPGNKFQWKSNRNSIILLKKMHWKLSSAKMAAILSRGISCNYRSWAMLCMLISHRHIIFEFKIYNVTRFARSFFSFTTAMYSCNERLQV